MLVLHSAPVPPSVNQAYRNVANRGRVASRSLLDYRATFAAWALQNSRILQTIALSVSEKKIALHLSFTLPRKTLFTLQGAPKRWDVSNRIKVIEDLLCASLGIDDKWVWKISAEKGEGAREGVDITLVTLD